MNAMCLLGLLLVLRATFTVRRKTNHENGFMSNILACHSSLNIVLFPPLFFFSALYYTDMASTLSVVLFYWYFLRDLPENHSLVRDATQILLGVLSLMFRQTNIFWVAVAPAILTLVAELDQGHRVVKESMYRRAEGFGDSTLSVAKTSWKMEVIYDPPIRDAFFEGEICCDVAITPYTNETQTTFAHSSPSPRVAWESSQDPPAWSTQSAPWLPSSS